jgi:hypothetical protein
MHKNGAKGSGRAPEPLAPMSEGRQVIVLAALPYPQICYDNFYQTF